MSAIALSGRRRILALVPAETLAVRRVSGQMFYSLRTLEAPLYKCLTKASDREAGVPRRSANWAVSRRGFFRVFRDRVEVGDWRISFADVGRATLYSFPYLFFFKASVLELEANGRTYQFGFNPWAHPEEHFPIPVEEREEKLQYSPFSIAVRVLVAAYIVYLIWDMVA